MSKDENKQKIVPKSVKDVKQKKIENKGIHREHEKNNKTKISKNNKIHNGQRNIQNESSTENFKSQDIKYNATKHKNENEKNNANHNNESESDLTDIVISKPENNKPIVDDNNTITVIPEKANGSDVQITDENSKISDPTTRPPQKKEGDVTTYNRIGPTIKYPRTVSHPCLNNYQPTEHLSNTSMPDELKTPSSITVIPLHPETDKVEEHGNVVSNISIPRSCCSSESYCSVCDKNIVCEHMRGNSYLWKGIKSMLTQSETPPVVRYQSNNALSDNVYIEKEQVTTTLEIGDKGNVISEQDEDKKTPALKTVLNGIHAGITAGLKVLSPKSTDLLPVKYSLVDFHWFYFDTDINSKEKMWIAFSAIDSSRIETNYLSGSNEEVSTDGGRYRVNVKDRAKESIYYSSTPVKITRCSWYIVDNDIYTPIEENVALTIEKLYENCLLTNKWGKQIEINENDSIIMRSHELLLHYSMRCGSYLQSTDFEIMDDEKVKKIVKRGLPEQYVIPKNENDIIDHVVFVVHGIGEGCDLEFRSIYECTDIVRNISGKMTGRHYSRLIDEGIVGRVEFIPVMWKLQPITLPSIPKLRRFTNNTLIDAIFYSSPSYRKKISTIVINEINRLYELFKENNTIYKGSFSFIGHSLGSIILFDILKDEIDYKDDSETIPDILSKLNMTEYLHLFKDISIITLNKITSKELQDIGLSLEHSEEFCKYVMKVKTNNLIVQTSSKISNEISIDEGNYLKFKPFNMFALGSPISMFLSARETSPLNENYRLPTCKGFFNIFHPFDPVAFRIEPHLGESFPEKPFLIPHHKGRKRFHIELKEGINKVSNDIKKKFYESVSGRWNTFASSSTDTHIVETIDGKTEDDEITIGKLNNNGKRVDYVLQESPVESINDYLFALTSHSCYWESEDTILFIVKELYSSIGIQIGKVEDHVILSNKIKHESHCKEVVEVKHLEPPPLSGFLKRKKNEENKTK